MTTAACWSIPTIFTSNFYSAQFISDWRFRKLQIQQKKCCSCRKYMITDSNFKDKLENTYFTYCANDVQLKSSFDQKKSSSPTQMMKTRANSQPCTHQNILWENAAFCSTQHYMLLFSGYMTTDEVLKFFENSKFKTIFHRKTTSKCWKTWNTGILLLHYKEIAPKKPMSKPLNAFLGIYFTNKIIKSVHFCQATTFVKPHSALFNINHFFQMLWIPQMRKSRRDHLK